MAELSTRRGRFAGGSAIVEKAWSGLGVDLYGVGVCCCWGQMRMALLKFQELEQLEQDYRVEKRTLLGM